jgi:tRNA(adenine34) deaminase
VNLAQAIYNPCVSHDVHMRQALAEAARARDAGEVPVGAVVVLDDVVVGSGFNQPISSHDPTAHAEIVALRAAAAAVGNYRLTGATLYVTVEPCLMCVGAMVHARIGLVVFGAPEPKAGAIQSMTRAHELAGLNHRLEALGGVLEPECRAIIQGFFQGRRAVDWLPMTGDLSGTYEDLVRTLLPRMPAPYGAAEIEVCGEFVRAFATPVASPPGAGGLSMRIGRFAIRKDDVPVFDTVLAVSVAAMTGGALSPAAIATAAAIFRLLHSLRSKGAWLDDDALRILTILQANVRTPADPGLTLEEMLTIVQRVTKHATAEWLLAQLRRLTAWPVPSAASVALVSESDGRWRPHA